MFTIAIDLARAKEILESTDCCYGEGMGGNLSFLLIKIKVVFPDLWDRHRYLQPLLVGRKKVIFGRVAEWQTHWT